MTKFYVNFKYFSVFLQCNLSIAIVVSDGTMLVHMLRPYVCGMKSPTVILIMGRKGQFDMMVTVAQHISDYIVAMMWIGNNAWTGTCYLI